VSAGKVAEIVLVTAGVVGTLACCAGLLVARDAFDRLHYAGAAGTVPSILIAAAVWVHEGPTQPSLNAAVVAVVLLLLNPLVVHATARAGRIAAGGKVSSTLEGEP